MTTYCKEMVPDRGRSVSVHSCARKAVKDGYCRQHHPDAVAKRKAERRDKWNAEWSVKQAGWERERERRNLLVVLREWYEHNNTGPSKGALLFDDERTFGEHLDACFAKDKR